MALGSLPRFRRRQDAPNNVEAEKESGSLQSTENEARLKRGTTTRRNAIFILIFFYLVAIVFLLLVEIGNTRNNAILGSMYFFKLDLTNVLVQSAPTSLSLQNSIARTLGLHDYYQPDASFWFNPVDILLNELLSGASIALPSEINSILNILRIASHIMFGFFLGGIVLNTILLVSSVVVLYSRWWSLPIGILSGISAVIVIVAAGLGTAISYVFQAALNSQPDLGVSASVGQKMLAFEWIAAGFTLLAFTIQAGLGCCCTSRRDLRTGRKGGRNAQGEKSRPDRTSEP
ncbi:hypothetical protein CHU98_g10913 [Xylaria longipes]|nr:hypothetical protein CHU98_g10913 [Xylaria longipes]